MEIQKREEKCTIGQREILVEFMAENIDFARNKLIGVAGKIKSHQLWTMLADELNKNGPEKSVEKWQRVWVDIKAKVKRKAAGRQASRRRTGGGSPENIVLTENDEKIVNILTKEGVYGIEGFDGVSTETEIPSSEIILETNKRKNDPEQGPSDLKKKKSSWVDLTEMSEAFNSPTESISENMYSPSLSIASNASSNISEDIEAERTTKKDSVAVKASKELKEISLNTSKEVSRIRTELVTLNSKFDKIIEQNNLLLEERRNTNEILKNMAACFRR